MNRENTLSPALLKMVDSRLDSIERILLSTDTSRSERREIIQSVEDQIYELLNRRGEAELTRESVLAVLAMIDPPEAYLGATDALAQNRTVHNNESRPSEGAELPRRISPLAVVSCVLGILSLFSIVLWPVSALAGLAAAICGTIALTQIHYSQRIRGVWLSIIGVSSPAIAMITLFVLVNL